MIKCCTTQNSIGTPTAEDMELINGYALKKLTPDEVFSFSVILCDNDIDRDFEQFSKESLADLEALFPGKTGILNHSMKSEDQTCRTYKTKLITYPERKTVDGRDYTCLKAWCYTVRSDKTSSLIRDIESGIKKEVSVSCAAGKKYCSVCGKEVCNHVPGKIYAGKICSRIIARVTDAYEWSFVAVPAQRKAGVTKSFVGEKSMESILKSIKEEKSITLGENEVRQLSQYMDSLKSLCDDGERYRSSLLESAKKSFALAIPEIPGECVDEILKNLSSVSLETLCTALKKQAESRFIPQSQFLNTEKTSDSSDNEFKF